MIIITLTVLRRTLNFIVMKVASYFTLKNADQILLRLWMETLPVRFKSTQVELLWRKSRGKKSIMWTHKGFRFFD